MFICGSIEPGCDGVGDYTICLARELIYQKFEIAILAINDYFVTEPCEEDRPAGRYSFKVLRLPSEGLTGNSSYKLEKWVNNFGPEWISLQFVPFAFHEKGLPVRLINLLFKLGKGRRCHIMFHELWVGMDIEASYKIRLWGQAQRFLIKLLLKGLKPDIIHTHTGLYQKHLMKLGYSAKYLPIFSNINVEEHNTPILDCIPVSDSPHNISLVAFGLIHPGALISLLADEAYSYVKETGGMVTLSLIGRVGEEKKIWSAVWKSRGLDFEELGELPENEISKILSKASIGLSTTPLALTEKSGSVAAMVAHGLPVLCISRKWEPRGINEWKPRSGVVDFNKEGLRGCLGQDTSMHFAPNIMEVSKQFAFSLIQSNVWRV